MVRSVHTPLLACLVLAGAVTVLWRAAAAGPPLICHAVEIGDRPSLPWGDGAFSKVTRYDSKRLIDETIHLLDKEESALVHMETLRRAMLYAHDDRELELELCVAITARALDAAATGREDPLLWLDAGYLAQAMRQLHRSGGFEVGVADGVVGYGWICKAIELKPDDPELHFAAAMVTAMANTPAHRDHVRKVEKLAGEDTLVMRNLRHHERSVWPHFRSR